MPSEIGPFLPPSKNYNDSLALPTSIDGSFKTSVPSLALSPVSSVTNPNLSPGLLPPQRPSIPSKRPLQPPHSWYIPTPTPTYPLSWKSRPQLPEWEWSYLSSRRISVTSTHAPSSPGSSTRRRSTMKSPTGSCWPLSWPWKNGGIGWREPNTPFWFSRITKTWSIFKWPKG